MDPDQFGNKDGWRAHCEAYFSDLQSQDGVRLPGDRRRANRQRITKDGFQIPESLYSEIKRLSS